MGFEEIGEAVVHTLRAKSPPGCKTGKIGERPAIP
jgi:hypothetical protein